MTLYLETSAVLAWLMQEPGGADVESVLGVDPEVVTSLLTLVECDRTLLRFVAQRKATASDAAALQGLLSEASSHWNLQPLDTAILARAREPFPDDAMRALDAIHIASALSARADLGPLDVVTLDDRVRQNAAALGFRVLPA